MMQIDLGCAASIHDPVAYFGEFWPNGDVHRHGQPRGWAVIGHDEVAAAFRDGEALSADRVSVLERVAAQRPDEFRLVVELLSGWMIFRDPPEHTRLRHRIRGAFTHRQVGRLEPMIRAVMADCFDRAMAGTGPVDLTEAVNRPVPALVIGAMLGVDPQDRGQLQVWSDELAAIVFSLSPRQTPSRGVVHAAGEFRDFFGSMIDLVEPDDDGLVAEIARLDDGFSRIEIIGLCTMLLFAGHETTTSLLQQMAAVLCERPDLVDALRADRMDRGMVVEEFVRLLGPARTMVRKVAEPHERGGVHLEPGETVLLSIAAANRDPRVFEDPERFDPGRDPNPHLGFGWGLHHCLGAQLARLEGVAFLDELVARFDELRPVGGVPPLGGSLMGFGRGPIVLHR